ncbi:hydroxyacid dehydrogenase [Eubacteriales bacterium OttesenSCG-928-M02]|nr:hydroxyacid dehydrogenase [Eubacteriales bacterium OttesenSCG-928-M02]
MATIFTRTTTPEARKYLEDRGHTLIEKNTRDVAEILSLAKDCDAILGNVTAKGDDFFSALPSLKILALYSAGFDSIDLAAAERAGVYVTNCGGGNSLAVAEHTMGLMNAASKLYKMRQHVFTEGNWDHAGRHVDGFELSGKTLLIVGVGHIGKTTAKIAALGYDMRVLGYHPRATQKDLPPYITPVEDLHAAIKQADVVSMHIPMSVENKHFFGKEEIALMKPTSIFVNTARGGVVDEKALIDALKEGRIWGAGLDVFEEEPIVDFTNPLFHMDNVFITPHVGGSREATERTRLIAAEQIDLVLSGKEPTLNVY